MPKPGFFCLLAFATNTLLSNFIEKIKIVHAN